MDKNVTLFSNDSSDRKKKALPGPAIFQYYQKYLKLTDNIIDRCTAFSKFKEIYKIWFSVDIFDFTQKS